MVYVFYFMIYKLYKGDLSDSEYKGAYCLKGDLHHDFCFHNLNVGLFLKTLVE